MQGYACALRKQNMGIKTTNSLSCVKRRTDDIKAIRSIRNNRYKLVTKELMLWVMWITAQEKICASKKNLKSLSGDFKVEVLPSLCMLLWQNRFSLCQLQSLHLSIGSVFLVYFVISLQRHSGVCPIRLTSYVSKILFAKFYLDEKNPPKLLLFFPLFSKCSFKSHDFLRKELPFYENRNL